MRVLVGCEFSGTVRQVRGVAMLTQVEVVQNPESLDEWIVEAQTEDGGIRRAIFIDADAEFRAMLYAEIIRSQGLLHQRRFAAENGDHPYAILR